jgi:hypothetical protein
MEDLMFIGFKDFYKRRKHIKTRFVDLPLKLKYKYKWYIYAHLLLEPEKEIRYLTSEKVKDRIWEWLHDDISNNDLKELYRKVLV